jgi:hypothetical protein
MLGNFNGNVTISSLSDRLGSTWNHTGSTGGGNGYAFAWAFANGTGADTLTVTWSSGSTNFQAWGEFTGSGVAARRPTAL